MAPKGRGGGYQDFSDGKGGGRRKGGKSGGFQKDRGGDSYDYDDHWSSRDRDFTEGHSKGGRGKGRKHGGEPLQHRGRGGDDDHRREEWSSSHHNWGGSSHHSGGWRGQSGGAYFGQQMLQGGYGGVEDFYAGMDEKMLWGVQAPEAIPLWTEYTADDGTPYYYNSRTGLTQWEKPAELQPAPQEADHSSADKGKVDGAFGSRSSGSHARGDGYDGEDRRRGGRGSTDEGRGPRDDPGRRIGKRKPRPDGAQAGGGGASKEPTEFGPPGCNLFVFHLPDDWTDDDLHEYFAPHGNVVSAKVMKELGTGRSRGFGFVSYEDRVSASTAIKKMQGYKILGKRLKVEFKKGEQEKNEEALAELAEEEEASSKKSYPDDERLIGYLRAITAQNVVKSLKEVEGKADEPGDGSHAGEEGDD